MRGQDQNIRYLKRREIDTPCWDHCVAEAPGGLLYMRSFWLDAIGDWDALVMGDYEYIMPLPWRRKLGIPYIYLPPFIGQLGIAGQAPVSPQITTLFLRSIPARFRLIDLRLNEMNSLPASFPGASFQNQSNYILPLVENYAALHDRYSGDARKNLRTAHRFGLSLKTDISMNTAIDFYRSAYGTRNTQWISSDYQRIESLGQQSIRDGYGFTLGVSDPEGRLQAASFFGKDNKRIYYLLGAPNEEGRKTKAIHFLVDEVIKMFAGTGLTFDFEGSDIPSVASFYQKFHPQKANITFVRINRLPRWLLNSGLPAFSRLR